VSIQDAILKAGGLQALADACGVRYQAVQRWVKEGPPEDRCPDIERVTGIRCEQLRSDLPWFRGPGDIPLLPPGHQRQCADTRESADA
jgi:DNA-binding transcriptional regulator YdaS (Cro superfamily)